MSKRIAQLPAATALDSTELVPISQGGVTKKVSIAAIRSPIIPVAGLSESEADAAANVAKIAAAVAALAGVGGTIELPVGRFPVNGVTVLEGAYVDLRGQGRRKTILAATLGAPAVLQLGVAELNRQYQSGKISDLTITRAAGVVDAATIGVDARYFSYANLEDVEISRHGILLKTGAIWGDGSRGARVVTLGIKFQRVHFHSGIVHCLFKDTAEVLISDSNFGQNGGDSVTPTNLVIFDGLTNGVQIKSTGFLPNGSSSSVAFKWQDILNADLNPGYYTLLDVNVESVDTIFQSDATCERIFDLNVSASRLTCSGKGFDFHTNTALEIEFIGNTNISFVTGSTLTNVNGVFACNRTISGQLIFNGGGGFVFGLNRVTTNTVFTGHWSGLVIGLNPLVFNESASVLIDTSAATGNVVNLGNVKDAGAQPDSILPGYLGLKGGPPIAVKRVTGTLDGSGNGGGAHGLPSNAYQLVLVAQAWYKGAGGLMAPMTVATIDGINYTVTGGVVGANFRVTFIYTNLAHVW